MSFEEEESRDFVGFLPDKASGSIDSFDEIDNPLVERAILDGEESETGAKEDGEDDERPLDDKDKIAGEEEIGKQETPG